MWADPRRFANNRHVDIADAIARFGDKVRRVRQKVIGRYPAPLGVAGREVLADVTSANSAQ